MALELPPGITALVGANGSGKSNLVDAIRWCLGEQNIRDLRGQRAEDVIYAGPRRTLGLAEVRLTFAGSDRQEAAELAIARRLYGSGESEYLVNGSKVRLRDVGRELRAIGIDGARYVVVNQGMADGLLSASPSERRGLLEQAAGLSGYRVRRDEARQKLATTAQNIQTIEVVLAELEPRLRILRRQSKAIRDRDEAAALLAQRLTIWYAERWRRLTEQMNEISQRTEAALAVRTAAGDRLRHMEEQAEGVLAAERGWQARVESAAAALHTTQREADEIRFGLEDTRRRLSELERSLVGADDERVRLEQRQSGALGRRREVDEQVAELAAERSGLEAQLAQLLDIIGTRRGELEGLQSEFARRESEARETSEKRDDALRAFKDIELSLSRDTDARERLRAELGVLRTAIAEAEGEEATSQAQLAEARSLETSKHAELERENDLLARARERSARLHALRARVQNLLTDTEKRAELVERSLSDLERIVEADVRSFEVESGWERAASAALAAGYIHRHPWTRDSRRAFDEWRKKIPLPAGCTWADSLIVDPEGRGHVDPLMASLFVEGVEAALALWEKLGPMHSHLIGSPPLRIFTRRGETIDSLGTRPFHDDTPEARFLHLDGTLRGLIRRRDVLRRRLAGLEKARTDAVRQEIQLGTFVADLSRVAQEASARVRILGLEAEERGSGRKRRQGEAVRLESKLVELEERIGRAQARQTDLEAELSCFEVAVVQAVEERDRSAERLALRKDDSAGSTEKVAALRHRQEMVDAKRDSLGRLGESLDHQIDALTEDLERHALTLVQRADLRQRLEAELAVSTDNYQRLRAIISEQSVHLESVQEARPVFAELTDLAALRSETAESVAAHERLAAQLDQLRSEADLLRLEIRRELVREAEDLLHPGAEDVPTDDEIRRLRFRANQYADADPSVVEECRELEERHSRLSRHLSDLVSASASLGQIMTDADAEMRARFDDAFEAVNEEFGRVFELMFGGGSARLEEVDEFGGIGIKAQLPGRKMHASSAFSGGEKTLVATSLLFGVLRMRPAPFCVLDEVDAALDERNVDRYLNVLRDISKRTQTIVVTHNRATMACADALYGMTMDSEGVSGLLSLRLDDYQAAS